MSIGTGVFLGLACLGAVLLYVQTKDRGRWRSIVLWMVSTPLLLGAIGLSSVTIWEYLHNRPERVNTYSDVSRGDSKQQVLYAKGLPTHVLQEPLSDDVAAEDLPEGKRVTDYLAWSYDFPAAARVDVDFSPQSQKVMRVFCYSSETKRCPSLAGIWPDMTEEAVVAKLGEPSNAWLSSDTSGTKYVVYPALHAAFFLTKLRVYGFLLESAPNPSPSFARASDTQRPKVPAECASARTATECADILEKAGKNPFDAFGTVDSEPFGGGQSGSAPPCISGAARCTPWERDWSSVDVPPGTVVTDDGIIIESSSPEIAPQTAGASRGCTTASRACGAARGALRAREDGAGPRPRFGWVSYC